MLTLNDGLAGSAFIRYRCCRSRYVLAVFNLFINAGNLKGFLYTLNYLFFLYIPQRHGDKAHGLADMKGHSISCSFYVTNENVDPISSSL